MLAVQIKAGDRKYDAVVFLAILSAELQKKSKTEYQGLDGVFAFVVNVDQDYISQMQKGDSNKIVDLMPNIAGFTWGNGLVNLNLEPTETVVSMQ